MFGYTAEEARDVAQVLAFARENDKPEFLRWVNRGIFNPLSFVFRTTNERINTKEYINTIKDKNKILSVIASGDQILNSILYGSKEIDGFDISIFPKYYLMLKIAAVKALDLEDFEKFFYSREYFDHKTYERVSKYLDEDSKVFWDGLINYSKHDKKKELESMRNLLYSKKNFDTKEYAALLNNIINKRAESNNNQLLKSELFSCDNVYINDVRASNPYMDKENYNELKKKIRNINIRFFDGDIFDLEYKLRDGYDLVNISSIIVANEVTPPSIKKQKKAFEEFSLKPNGEVLSYLFEHDVRDYLSYGDDLPNEEGYKGYRLTDNTGHVEDAILVYKKTK